MQLADCILCEVNPIEDVGILTCNRCAERIARYEKDRSKIRYFLRWFVKIGKLDAEMQADVFKGFSPQVQADLLHGLEHRKGLLFEPLPFQIDFYRSGAFTKCAVFGNQTGKSLTLMISGRNFMLGDYPDEWPERFKFEPPTIGRLWVLDFKLMYSLEPKIGEFFDDWPQDWQPNDTWDFRKNKEGHVVFIRHIPTGSTLDVCSAEQDDMIAEGWQGHYALFDEPPPQAKYTGTKRGLIVRQGQAIIGGTLLREPWINRELIRKQERGIIECFHATMDDNCVDNGGVLTRQQIELSLASAPAHERIARRRGVPIDTLDVYYPQLSDVKYVDKIFVKIEPPLPKDWLVVSVTDYHRSTPVFTLWMAVTSVGQFIFFDELIAKLTPAKYVAAMIAKEREWSVNRLKARLVDQTIDENYKFVVNLGDQEFATYNPFNAYQSEFTTHGTLGFTKVTNAAASIEIVQGLFDPRIDEATGKEFQPFVIGHHCVDLRETLPDYAPAIFKSGPMKGESKEEPDKQKAAGSHSIDCFHYPFGMHYTWEALERLPPMEGTFGRAVYDMIQEDDSIGEQGIGTLVAMN